MLFDKDTIDQINNSFDPANAAYSSDRYTNEPGRGGRITPMDAVNASVMMEKINKIVFLVSSKEKTHSYTSI